MSLVNKLKEFADSRVYKAPYHTVELFTKALSKLPAKWQKAEYLDISFTEHQRCLVAKHQGLGELYYIGGEWCKWTLEDYPVQRQKPVVENENRGRND